MKYYEHTYDPTGYYDFIPKMSAKKIIKNQDVFLGTRHDELLKCSGCSLKYDTHRLTRIDIGKFLCQYCIQKREKK